MEERAHRTAELLERTMKEAPTSPLISPNLQRIAKMAKESPELIDADIRDFFGSLDHAKLREILSQRVGDHFCVALQTPRSDEPDARVAHVRICGSPGGVTPRGHPADGLRRVGRDPP